jgi:hypothetical protein
MRTTDIGATDENIYTNLLQWPQKMENGFHFEPTKAGARRKKGGRQSHALEYTTTATVIINILIYLVRYSPIHFI